MEYEKIEITYEGEVFEDNVLKDIKRICFTYLENPNAIENVSDDEIITGYIFLSNKMKELMDMQRVMKLQPYNYPLTEIAQTLDNLTINDLRAKVMDTAHTKLKKDLSTALDTVGLTFGVMNRIVKERELDRN